MDSQYQEVNTTEEITNKKASLQSFLKQSFVCSVVWMQYLMAGLCVGAPTVILPQLRKENSTYVISDELSSWIYALPPMSVLPWVVLLPLFTKLVGRKIPQIITSFVSIIAFTIMYCSTNPYHILISELVQGYLHAGNLTYTVLSITEYSSPKWRGFFLSVSAAGFYWGLWIANAIGALYHWKNIGLVGMICSVYTLSVLFWPESPFWLASRGRFEESKVSFRWVHGFESEKDLEELILVKERDLNAQKTEVPMGLVRTIRCPEFYKPLLLSMIVILQYLFSGKLVCCIFILDIFKNITSSEDSAYIAMLILDGVTLFCIYIGTYLAKILKRRTLYFSSSFIGIFFLFIISLYLFLIKFKWFGANNYLTLGLMTAFSMSISVGPMILSGTIYGELICSKFQASSYSIVASIVAVCYSIWVKLTPKIFAAFGLEGSFLLYAITCSICTIYLYVHLPETKDKTRWEIDNFFCEKKTKSGKL